MNFETIREKSSNKQYRTALEYPSLRKVTDGHIFDEDKSVKWNKEEVIKYNDAVTAAYKAYSADEHAKYNEFVADVMLLLTENEGFTEAQARAIYSRAYDEGHSSGASEILGCVADYIDFARKLLNK